MRRVFSFPMDMTSKKVAQEFTTSERRIAMSHYVECTPGFKDRAALIEALVAVGFDRGHIEIHAEAVPRFGYRGDQRPHHFGGQ